MSSDSLEPNAMKRDYEAAVGPWDPALDIVLRSDVEITRAMVDFVRGPFVNGPLPRKFKHLVLLAASASVTFLHRPSLRYHVENALREGATREEIIETLELASVIGAHTCTTGLPILMEELRAAGQAPAPELNERQRAIKETFIAGRGWWGDFLETMLLLDPDLLEAYVAYSTVPWKKGHIPPKLKELIYIAIDSQTTHLYELGLRQHIRNAIKLGATKEEITEVFALLSSLGRHTLSAGLSELEGCAGSGKA